MLKHKKNLKKFASKASYPLRFGEWSFFFKKKSDGLKQKEIFFIVTNANCIMDMVRHFQLVS